MPEPRPIPRPELIRDEVAIRLFVNMVSNASGGVSASDQWYVDRAAEAIELAAVFVRARRDYDMGVRRP